MKALLLTLIIASSTLANSLETKLSNTFTQMNAQAQSQKQINSNTFNSKLNRHGLNAYLHTSAKWDLIRYDATLKIIAQDIKAHLNTKTK